MSSVVGPPASAVVFLIDDDGSVRRSLRRFLSLSGYDVVDYESPGELLARPPHAGDGCIVTDLKMPEMSGTELQRAAQAAGWELPFVFISGHGGVPDAVQAFKAGAVDFLEKPLDPEQLLLAVGRAIEAGRLARRERHERERARQLVDRLTPRERQVCQLVGAGLLNKQIAAELGTSEKTVKAQRSNAIRKMQANSTAELVNILRAAGL